MEFLDLNWFRLVLDGATGGQVLIRLALPVLGFPVLIATCAAVVMDKLSIRTGIAVLAGALLAWYLTFLVVG